MMLHKKLDEMMGFMRKYKSMISAVISVIVASLTLAILASNINAGVLEKCELATGGQCRIFEVGDGKCDWNCNVASCEYDRGDCQYYTPACRDAWLMSNAYSNQYASVALTTTCFTFEDSGVPATFPLKNSQCDLRCNFPECGFDGGDCTAAALRSSPQCNEGCYSHMLGDNICQHECDTAGCLWDFRDCAEHSAVWGTAIVQNSQSPLPDNSQILESIMCDRSSTVDIGCGFNHDPVSLMLAMNFRDTVWGSGHWTQRVGRDPTWNSVNSLCVFPDCFKHSRL